MRLGIKGAAIFLTNAEKDEEFKAWPSSVSTLLQPSWGMHVIRKNLYTIILVLDPMSLQARSVESPPFFYVASISSFYQILESWLLILYYY